MFMLILLLSISANESLAHSWTFDEIKGQFIPSQNVLGNELFKQEKYFDPGCHMCSQINKTNCMFLPTEKTCFEPQIVYYSGHRCLMARVTCHAAYLLIRGTNLNTGKRDLWDQRVPVNKSKVFYHRWPNYGEPYLAMCTGSGFWMISAGIKPYENIPVAIERLYCTI